MGMHPNIGIDKFPKQGQNLGKSVIVCFNYDASRVLDGEIVRDDMEEPWTTLIRLTADDRIVDSTECMYSIPS